MLPDAVIELAREAADDRLVAGIGEAQAAARQTAEVPVGRDDDDGLAHARGLNGGRDGGRGAAVDHDVVSGARLRPQERRRERSEPELQQCASIHCGWPGAALHIVSSAAISSIPSQRFWMRRFSLKLCWLLS